MQGCDRVPIKDTTAIVIDDGIATGATVNAALKALRRSKPKKLVLTLAVAPRDKVERLQADVDEIICLETPEPFYAIGLYYRDFGQVRDEDVVALLAQSGRQAKEKAAEPR